MQQVLLYALLGLGSGALIAGIALGVVLTYRGSGIINLATGGFAMLAGYAFWAIRVDLLHWSTGPALAASLVVVLAAGAATELVAFRPLRTASPLAKLVSSLGVLLVLQASMLLAFGSSEQPEPNVLPQNIVHLLGAVIPIDRFILTGIVIALTAALAALYRFTRFGLATRAASENEVVAMLGGLSPNALSMVNTLLGFGDRRWDRHPGRVDHPARHRDAPAPDRARTRRGAAGPLHLVRDRLRGWDRARDHRVGDPVRLEPLLVPDVGRDRDSGRRGARDLHSDRAVHVPARGEAARARRAGREASA